MWRWLQSMLECVPTDVLTAGVAVWLTAVNGWMCLYVFLQVGA
jgi:hypothetical protein